MSEKKLNEKTPLLMETAINDTTVLYKAVREKLYKESHGKLKQQIKTALMISPKFFYSLVMCFGVSMAFASIIINDEKDTQDYKHKLFFSGLLIFGGILFNSLLNIKQKFIVDQDQEQKEKEEFVAEIEKENSVQSLNLSNKDIDLKLQDRENVINRSKAVSTAIFAATTLTVTSATTCIAGNKIANTIDSADDVAIYTLVGFFFNALPTLLCMFTTKSLQSEFTKVKNSNDFDSEKELIVAISKVPQVAKFMKDNSVKFELLKGVVEAIKDSKITVKEASKIYVPNVSNILNINEMAMGYKPTPEICIPIVEKALADYVQNISV